MQMEDWDLHAKRYLSMEEKKYLWDQWFLEFGGLGGPLQYLSINAGNQLRDSNSGNFNYEEAINQIRTLKQPEKFDQLTINKLPENAWHFGNISAQTSNLDLGLVKVGSLGAGVQGSVGTTKIPYGFFKYNDPTKVIDGTGGVSRDLDVFAKDVTLELGSFAKTIGGVAQGVQKFTSYAKGPLDTLTQTVSAFNDIPSWGVIDLRGDFIRFVKDFKGNTRKNQSGVHVVELIDKFVSLSGGNFRPMTPVVNTAKEFVDNIDLLSLAEGKSANSLTLPDLQYTLNTDNKTSTLTQKGSLPSINREDLRAKGIPTMGSTTGIAASTNSSSYANISFPVVNDIGGLLKKVFLTPEEDIDLAQLNLGLDLEAEVSGRAGVGFSASVGGKASLAMKTALTAGLSMNDIYESIDNPEEILNNFSNIVLKKSAIDLSQTELDVHAGLTLGAGINIYPEQWWTWGLGAELTVDVVGNMKVQPVIQGSSTQKLYLYDLLHSNSSRRLFEPTYQSRTKSQNQWSQPVQRTSADGFTGSIRSRLVDYEALIALNFKDYLGKETRAAEAENYLNINVGFDKPLYLNKKTLRVSHMPGDRNSSILINETGWLTTQYSIASIIKSFSENNIRGSAGVTLVRFDDKYINNQLQQTFKKDLFKELKDQESMKSKVERNIETITNRIIAVAIPEDIGVGLHPARSTP